MKKNLILISLVVLNIGFCSAEKVKYDIFMDKIQEDTIKRDSNYVYIIVDEKPEFPGGYDSLNKFIRTNLQYPQIMQEHGIQGRVVCQFIIEKTGKVSNVKVIKKLDPSGDKEAIRLIESIPDWIPGKQNGVPVRTLFAIPIVFKLQ